MDFTPTAIKDVILIAPKVYGDERGFFLETFRESRFREAGIKEHFVQDNLSFSQRNAVRGLHYQIRQPQAKLVMVTQGRVLDVAVDLRRGSPTFGQHVAAELSEENKHILYIPVGFAHGFSVLSESASFQYKCSDYYFPEGERGLRWDDPALNIDWRVGNPILSDKDQAQPLLSEISEEDLFNYKTDTQA